MGDSHRGAAVGIVRALDKDCFRRLIEVAPFHLRSLLTPDGLLAKLDIDAQASLEELAVGIAILVEEPSGNFIVDEPFLFAMYRVVADRAFKNPGDMAGTLGQSSFPLEGFIQRHPAAATAVLRSGLETALSMVRQSDAVVSPPARIIYLLMHADPALASDLIVASDERGSTVLVAEALAYFAYDEDRSKVVPGLINALEGDGNLLQGLLGKQGPDWLTRRLAEAFLLHGDDGPADFRARYRSTLNAAVATLGDASVRVDLEAVIEKATAGKESGR